MEMKKMKTLTLLKNKFEIVDEKARESVKELNDSIGNIINDRLVVFQGATDESAGQKGLVPAPDPEHIDKFLCGNGQWMEAANKSVEQAIDSHLANTSNPHKITCNKIGAATTGHNHDTVYAAIIHNHNYAASDSVGGNALVAEKANSLTHSIEILGNGKFIESFDGSSDSSINITPAKIGAATSNHGVHIELSSATPKALGSTASAGAGGAAARYDHIHPLPSLSDIGVIYSSIEPSVVVDGAIWLKPV